MGKLFISLLLAMSMVTVLPVNAEETKAADCTALQEKATLAEEAVKEKEEALKTAQAEEEEAVTLFEEADGILDEAAGVISPVLEEALTDSATDVRIANKVLASRQSMVEDDFFGKYYLDCIKEIEEVLQPALDEAEAAYAEALKTSDFDETFYDELVEKAKTDTQAAEELTAYEETYASVIALKDARDDAQLAVTQKKTQSEYYLSLAGQIVIDFEDAQEVVTLVEARNTGLVSFNEVVKSITEKDPLTEDVSSLVTSVEQIVSTMKKIEENGMEQYLWPNDLQESYTDLSSRMEEIIVLEENYAEDAKLWKSYADAAIEKKALVEEAETALSTAQEELENAQEAYDSACTIVVPDEPETDDPEIDEPETDENVLNIQNAKPGDTVEVSAVLTKDVLAAAKEKQVVLQIVGNGFTWEIDAATITDEAAESVSLSIDRVSKNIPTALVEKTVGNNTHYEFEIAHDGEFGFDAKLSFFTDKKHSGKTAELYRFENNALNKAGETIVAEDGYATFSLDHASSYVIVIKEPKADTTHPDTGAGQLPVAMAFVCGVTGILSLMIIRKKKEA